MLFVGVGLYAFYKVNPLEGQAAALVGAFGGVAGPCLGASLRGYDPAVVYGEQYHLINLEYRFPICWLNWANLHLEELGGIPPSNSE